MRSRFGEFGCSGRVRVPLGFSLDARLCVLAVVAAATVVAAAAVIAWLLQPEVAIAFPRDGITAVPRL